LLATAAAAAANVRRFRPRLYSRKLPRPASIPPRLIAVRSLLLLLLLMLLLLLLLRRDLMPAGPVGGSVETSATKVFV